MATVPGPPTSLADVRAVFGAPAGTPLHNFVRGGPWVPNVPQNANVPTAVPIRLAQLAGATNYQPVSVSGPTNYNFGTIYLNKPPNHVSRTTSNTTGGTNAQTYNWVRTGGDYTSTCSNTAALNPTFTVSGQVGFSPGSGFQPFTEYWQLTVSDGITSAQLNITLTGSYEEI